MEQTKEQVLDELYALRAGLSVISEGNDKIMQASENAMWSIDSSVEDEEKAWVRGEEEATLLGWYPKPLGGQCLESEEVYGAGGLMSTWKRGGYSDDEYKESYCLESIQELWAISHKDKKRFQKRHILTIICCVIAVCSLILAVTLLETLQPPLDYFIGGIFVVLTVLLGVLIWRNRGYMSHKTLRTYTEIPDKLMAAYPAWKANAKRIVAEMEQIVIPILDKCDALHKVLYDKYSLLLDERDWQYLDLIIFYLETGRADTMKEALQLVEREVQTQKIIDKIEEATRRICAAIEAAARRIAGQLGVISSQLSTVISLQSIQIGQTSRLVSGLEMNNALIKKANVTSEKLMKDVAQIKSYIKK